MNGEARLLPFNRRGQLDLNLGGRQFAVGMP
jgi:hypothetical protein